ncbi:MAG: hypothetical protein MI757_07165, partial [Pirellulales bacterium]|nr:hypothetical protein [Pirellulales bacterium]
HVVYYARTHGMYALGRRPQLIPDRLIEDVVRDEYITTSPHTFGENEQTWYTLHQLLEYDDRVIAQLQTLNQRATGDEHVVALGVIGTGVLGLLGLAFVLLKATEKKTPKPSTTTDWTAETTKPKKAKRKACDIRGKRWSKWR